MCDVLIGMDIITLGDFAVTNRDGITVMSFRTPAQGRIDYVKHINQVQGTGNSNQRAPTGGKAQRKKKKR